MNMSIEQVTNNELINTYLIPWASKIVLALVIFIVGRWLARWLTGIARKLMERSKLDDMLVNFLGSIIYSVLLAVVVLASLEQLGVNTTSALAILGAAGLAVGLALKDSLANFAAGVMLIIFRPFKTGDFIEAAGTTGTVEEVRIFSTVLRTGDNREITIPNGKIYDGTIINYSARSTRRIDLIMGIGYDDNIADARDIIEAIMATDKRILQDPAPVVMVSELADSSVNLAVRPWVNSGDYWAVRSDLLEQVKNAFDREGISIPYPQTDIHMHKVA